ncbi:MAG: serine/threonine protein kinase [Candidatus Melainabacteria bacterium]|nr:serine/threonine protein kinase [Candidatus Melainabacteria bacterium]
MDAQFTCEQMLKSDAFGRIEKGIWYHNGTAVQAIRRVYTQNIWRKPLARWLANNEKTALCKLAHLAELGYVPRVLATTDNYHIRSFMEAEVLYRTNRPVPRKFFLEARRVLHNMRHSGVCHNDLAKEGNWLVCSGNNLPALVDFQLAFCFRDTRHTLFLTLCHEDLRHLLKHKRKYVGVTACEKGVLAKKSLLTRVWMATGKKVYLFFTRKILGWQERNGPCERDF